MSTIRLTKTKELKKILEDLRRTRFQLLDDTEIIKAIISEHHYNHHLSQIPSRMATKEEEKAIARAMEDIKKGRVKVIEPHEEIDVNLF